MAAGVVRYTLDRGPVGQQTISSVVLTAALLNHVDGKPAAHLQAASQKTFYSRSADGNFQGSKHATGLIDAVPIPAL